MKKSMRKGFTLVELLIVIVVIGILSAMMMLSSTEAVSSARAADIISDLRNLKTATLAWYADHLDFVEGNSFGGLMGHNADQTTTVNVEIAKYMGNEGNISKYSFTGQNPGTWCVWRQVDDDSRVQEKLKSRAETVGLIGSNSPNISTSGDVYGSNNTLHKYVGMFVR